MRLHVTLRSCLVFVAGISIGFASLTPLLREPESPDAPIEIHLFTPEESGESYMIYMGRRRPIPRWTMHSDMEQSTFTLHK